MDFLHQRGEELAVFRLERGDHPDFKASRRAADSSNQNAPPSTTVAPSAEAPMMTMRSRSWLSNRYLRPTM